MTRDDFLRDYWAYYLMLEKKFVQTLNYVSLTTDNESTYSNEYAGLIQMIGAEMDSFFKVYCGFGAAETKKLPTTIQLLQLIIQTSPLRK